MAAGSGEVDMWGGYPERFRFAERRSSPDNVRTMAVPLAALAVLALATGSCAQLGVVSDGTSVSVGRTNGGTMIDPVRIPDEGDGYWAPPIWRDRGSRYGVDELVDLLAAVGRKVSAQFPGSRVAIGDLSRLRGGGSEHHR